MKKGIFIALIILFSGFMASAQDYKTGIGFRGGLGYGLSLKHFTGKEVALEGIFISRWAGFYAVGLWEKHSEIRDVDGLSWFYGVGGHIGNFDGDASFWNDPNQTRTTVIGVDGIIGLDFTIPNAPINFQLDYKPAFNLIGYNGFWGDQFALSIRYAIK